MEKKTIPLILSGGSGSRLWPLSRKNYPKQFLPIFENESLFSKTLNRLDNFRNYSFPPSMIITSKDHRELIKKELSNLSSQDIVTLYEPIQRNTAAAITVSCLECEKIYGPDTYVLVLPSDHIFLDNKSLEKSILEGIELADEKTIVFFGIKPDKAHTGYGYIRYQKDVTLSKVEEFIEKPALEDAQKFFKDESYLWNAGIFLVNCSYFLSLIRQINNKFYKQCESSLEFSRREKNEVFLNEENYNRLENISVDYMIMEKINDLNFDSKVIPIDAGWDDMGSWDSVFSFLPKDHDGNNNSDQVSNYGSSKNLVLSNNKVVTLGIKDTIIVNTNDVLFVSSKNQSENLRHALEDLSTIDSGLVNDAPKTQRPWGFFENLIENDAFKIKLLSVNPNQKLSKQSHKFRAETWTIISGEATITLDKKVFVISAGESVHIPLGSIHRLENKGTVTLELIEVQTGSYFGEDDITRYDDIYGRN